MGRKFSVCAGQKYGRLLVTGERAGAKIVCLCDCGGQVSAHPRNLRDGITRHCNACRQSTTKHGHKRGALVVGDWIGGLQAIEKAGKRGRYQIWRFRCICGGWRTETATEMKRYVGPTCGHCGDNMTFARPFGVEYWSKYYAMHHEAAKRAGYKLYDISQTPPKLMYDPEGDEE